MIIQNVSTIEYIIERLENDRRFCYIRYGDGDLIAMYPQSRNERVGSNNRSIITEDVQKWLIRSYNIDKEDYLIGTIQDIIHQHSDLLSSINFNILDSIGLKHPKTLYSAIAVQEAFLNYPELFKKFKNCLRQKRSLYINHYFEPILEDYYGQIVHWIKVPKFNACEKHNDIVQQIFDLDSNSFDQIILSCGQLSRVISSRLYNRFTDKNIIDVGSCTDMLILDTESFNTISVRGHIKRQEDHIRSRLGEYTSSNYVAG